MRKCPGEKTEKFKNKAEVSIGHVAIESVSVNTK